MNLLSLVSPQVLTEKHLLDNFECGEYTLDNWLKRRAMSNQVNGASRTFVVVDKAHSVFGYYAMAAGAVSHQLATSSIRRNMPDPVPVMVLGRLAVDLRAQGIKLGAAMLQDAVNRSIVVSQNTGVRALLVHAINDRAKQFYEHYGFQESPQHPMTLMLRLNNYKVPNLVTSNAIEELEFGKGQRSNNIDELMADLNAND